LVSVASDIISLHNSLSSVQFFIEKQATTMQNKGGQLTFNVKELTLQQLSKSIKHAYMSNGLNLLHPRKDVTEMVIVSCVSPIVPDALVLVNVK